jgi:hypothetical protein
LKAAVPSSTKDNNYRFKSTGLLILQPLATSDISGITAGQIGEIISAKSSESPFERADKG